MFLAAAVLLLPTGAYAQDAMAVVRKMEAAYAGMKSYSQKMSATGKVVIGTVARMSGMTSELRISRPNQLFIVVSNPGVGTIAAFTDGKQQTVFHSLARVYTQTAASPTLKDFVADLKTHSVVAILDPLYFLIGEKTDKYATGFKQLKPEKINNYDCDVVVDALKPGTPLNTGKSGTITFWVEQKTGLLRKLEMQLLQVPSQVAKQVTKNNKTGAEISKVLSDQTITEVIQELQVNPPLGQDSFTYPIPKGTMLQDPSKFTSGRK